MAQLQGKVALVTGGSRGIGAAIATRLAQDGADVAVTYVSSPDKANAVISTVKRFGRRGLAIQADSADAGDVINAVQRTAAELGRLDILVNNAGVYSTEPLETISLSEVDRVLNINARSVFIAIQAALPLLGEGGRIINIGSCLAERVPGPGMALYSMSKAALIGLTKGLSRDLGPRGITVNVVQPGPIDTDMNPASGPAADEERKQVALGRFGTGADIAAMVSHLAGEGGQYITGAALAVDGGFGA